MTIDKTFDPAAIETRWYTHWERAGLFRPARPDAAPFTIVIPPPNVTGSLHIGHALDNTLQDILVRHARLKGRDALWVVGTDHAGIATQMVVERQLAATGETRAGLGREAFVERVWRWKEESGGHDHPPAPPAGRVVRLGERALHDGRGLFAGGDARLRPAPPRGADLSRQEAGQLGPPLPHRDLRPRGRDARGAGQVLAPVLPARRWIGDYPGGDDRPETMLADMAVAVHPDDDRYRALVGRHVRLPITGRLVPIVADEHADPALGSGAVKITPGHDFNDFEVGRRAGSGRARCSTCSMPAARSARRRTG